MIISNRYFMLQGPIRADLYGRPFGFIFMWRPRPVTNKGKFEPMECAFSWGFIVPSSRRVRGQQFAAVYLWDAEDERRRDLCLPVGALQLENAVTRKMQELGAGAKIVADKTDIDRRGDLTGQPWQVCREITVKIAA